MCSDPTKDFLIRKMIEGWNKERGRIADKYTPISSNVLVRSGKKWVEVCKDHYEILLFRPVTLLALFGALRVSELVSASKVDKSKTALQVDGVVVSEDQIMIHL